ncbi:hypothetical protein ASPBRDRAFT_43120 [Aspergillus brasiliensis CBS 101740]|uniref:Uncharacterized protein n=1 Tax=Aspergillus brasiliensis (strain CBS 101740 / IMI 381727 / IBT 21946) TaxID=767769 RepID=A0A1L9UJ60_ASPBC|nr:hypothetical protein ASPBRDRAFT_43120 [Aspergillus brasiliensis CBS 101740]
MTDSVTDITNAINTALSKLSPADNIPDTARYQLLDAIERLRRAVEPPLVTLQKICFAHHKLVAIRIGMSMGIFDAFIAANGAEMTATEVDGKTKGDKGILVRIMRVLCTKHIFKETGVEKYQPQPLAAMFASSSPYSKMITHYYPSLRASAYLDGYLHARNYHTPQDAYDTPFQLAHATKGHYFDWLRENPEDENAFHVYMESGNRSVEGEQWYEFYPWKERLQKTTNADRVLLVDIGGGKGHDICRFKQRNPDVVGRLVIQDLPSIIEGIQTPLVDGVEAIAYNMFEAQPIKVAKAYYMRTVLHDWPDKQALEVLGRVREAMADDSVLLVNENVSPEERASEFMASMDIIMMVLFSSLERSEKQWIELLEKARFRVVKVWRSGGTQGVGSNALFEAVVA